MSRQIIKGEDIILTAQGKPMLHATSHSLSVSLDLQDFRTKDTDGDEKDPGDISWTAQVEALIVVDESIENSLSNEDVLGLMLGKTKVAVVLKSKLPGSALTKTYTGNGYITQFDYKATVNEKASYSATITGSGTLTPAADPKPTNQQSNTQNTEQ